MINVQSNETIIVVGGGVAGSHAVQSMRKEGFSGEIILFDEQSDQPYDRPPLSKEFMSGKQSIHDITLMNDEAIENLNINWKPNTKIKTLDVENKEVVTSEGASYRWDKLLIATGAKLRQLNDTATNYENVFYLKTLQDAKNIRFMLNELEKIVIVGAGFIGAELASTLSELGKEVHLIERADLPMSHIFGDEIGEYFFNLHKKNGINIITGDSVKEIHQGNEKAEAVVTESGKRITCDALIIGIGVEPNIPFKNEKFNIARGYIVDQYGETSVPDVFATGDCAMWPYQKRYININHWDHAVFHSQVVAKNMVNEEKTAYERIPYFWSDQFGMRIQYVGHLQEWHSTVLRGDFTNNKFTYFYLDKNETVQAVLVVNEPQNIMSSRRLIASQKRVNKDDLTNRDVSLRSILQSNNTIKS